MTDLTLEEAEALGRRWMACERFEWQPGMRVQEGPRSRLVEAVDDDCVWLSEHDGEPLIGDIWPDLRDPGTRGWALEQLRKALGYPVSTHYRRSTGKMSTPRRRWLIEVPRDAGLPSAWVGDTEAEVIINTLETLNG